MATNMAVGMGAWMRFRGHSWRGIAEMSASMYVPFAVLLVPFWAGAIGAGTPDDLGPRADAPGDGARHGAASGRVRALILRQTGPVPTYVVNDAGVARARELIDARQYVLRSEWGRVQPSAADENDFLQQHSWAEYSAWHLGLTEGATDETKARYAFVYGDFRRVHRMGLIACHYRAAEWGHKEIELAAHDLLQRLDAARA